MSAIREELHHLVDQLPDNEVGPVLRLVQDRVADNDEPKRDLPFIGMLEAESDFAERSEEILREGFGR